MKIYVVIQDNSKINKDTDTVVVIGATKYESDAQQLCAVQNDYLRSINPNFEDDIRGYGNYLLSAVDSNWINVNTDSKPLIEYHYIYDMETKEEHDFYEVGYTFNERTIFKSYGGVGLKLIFTTPANVPLNLAKEIARYMIEKHISGNE